MRSRWSDMAGIVGLGVLLSLGAGCDCSKVRTENEDLKKRLETLTVQQSKVQRENDRLNQAARQHQTRLKAAQAQASKAKAEAQQAAAQLARLKARKAAAPKPPKAIKIPGVAVTHEGDRIRLSISGTTLFAQGKTVLTRSARTTLVRVAQELNKAAFKGKLVGVEGHTDSDPIRKTRKLYKDNHDLAAQRARAVFDYLATVGKVDRARLFVAGYGPVTPVAPNTTATGKAKNRRVEVVIYNKPVAAPKKKK